MRRLVALVAIFTLVPASMATARGLEDLLERSREASYTAEQTISCSTPDGVRDAVVKIAQSGGEIRVGSTVSEDVEVSAGDGGWTLSRGGGVVKSATVGSGDRPVEPLYLVEDDGATWFQGRTASVHRLMRDGVLRAELLFDVATGALVAATTFSGDGTEYCERRFVSFDPTDPGFEPKKPAGTELEATEAIETSLPETVAGFTRLDVYEDVDGLRFAYYSDGFFSFAVFQTPTTVFLPEAVRLHLGKALYERLFTAGQVTYAWETLDGGMALVGDLPPDLHETVLTELPQPHDPGLFRRLWRHLFG